MTPSDKLSQKQIDVGQLSGKSRKNNKLTGVPGGTTVPVPELSHLPLSPPLGGEGIGTESGKEE